MKNESKLIEMLTNSAYKRSPPLRKGKLKRKKKKEKGKPFEVQF